ncbi:MAG: RNA polymerase sigma factor [Ruminococcaceae bacterium]|nr:RNA polymerase sigma factor [Oscillospiraceae bacterium]
MPVDRKIIQKAKLGDEYSFECIVKEYQKKVYGYALAKTKNSDDALDLSQNIFMKLYKSIKSFREECSFDTFLYKIIFTATADFLKKRLSNQTSSLYNEDGKITDIKDSVDVEKDYEKKEMMSEVINALESLSKEQRECFILRNINGYSYKEISKITGIGEETVKTRIHRARNKVIEIIKKDGNKNKVQPSNISKGDEE